MDESNEEEFDFEQDIKDESGMNITEKRLYDSMKEVGLNPIPQYPISQMKVDFAFLEEKVVIEINGPYHNSEEQTLRDKKRWFVLNNLGWKRKTYKAEYVYNNPEKYAELIKTMLIKESPNFINIQDDIPDSSPKGIIEDIIIKKREKVSFGTIEKIMGLIWAIYSLTVVFKCDSITCISNLPIYSKIISFPAYGITRLVEFIGETVGITPAVITLIILPFLISFLLIWTIKKSYIVFFQR